MQECSGETHYWPVFDVRFGMWHMDEQQMMCRPTPPFGLELENRALVFKLLCVTYGQLCNGCSATLRPVCAVLRMLEHRIEMPCFISVHLWHLCVTERWKDRGGFTLTPFILLWGIKKKTTWIWQWRFLSFLNSTGPGSTSLVPASLVSPLALRCCNGHMNTQTESRTGVF